jgi:hypothetical protein
MEFIWISSGCAVDFIGFPTVFIGFPVFFAQFSHRNVRIHPIDFLWISYGFDMIFTDPPTVFIGFPMISAQPFGSPRGPKGQSQLPLPAVAGVSG